MLFIIKVIHSAEYCTFEYNAFDCTGTAIGVMKVWIQKGDRKLHRYELFSGVIQVYRLCHPLLVTNQTMIIINGDMHVFSPRSVACSAYESWSRSMVLLQTRDRSENIPHRFSM